MAALTRAEATAIMREVEAAAAKIFEAHGLERGKCSASFEEGKIKVSVTGEGTGADSPKIKDWTRYAESFGLPVDAIGKTITVNRKQFVITGLAITRRKFPVCVTEVLTGKDMLLTAEGVRAALGLPRY
jgi:hypothetical protein